MIVRLLLALLLSQSLDQLLIKSCEIDVFFGHSLEP